MKIEFLTTRCPKCKSDNIEKLGTMHPNLSRWMSRRLRCKECNYEWTKQESIR